jgi:hypothetical protein
MVQVEDTPPTFISRYEQITTHYIAINRRLTVFSFKDHRSEAGISRVTFYAWKKKYGRYSRDECNLGALRRQFTAALMPSGYTASALIGVWSTNASSQLGPGFQRDLTLFFAAKTLLTTAPCPSRQHRSRSPLQFRLMPPSASMIAARSQNISFAAVIIFARARLLLSKGLAIVITFHLSQTGR